MEQRKKLDASMPVEFNLAAISSTTSLSVLLKALSVSDRRVSSTIYWLRNADLLVILNLPMRASLPHTVKSSSIRDRPRTSLSWRNPCRPSSPDCSRSTYWRSRVLPLRPTHAPRVVTENIKENVSE